MKRIKQLIEDHKKCWDYRKTYRIKWRIKLCSTDDNACLIYLIPTIVYNTYPYRGLNEHVFYVCFLHWYLGIGEWCNKEDCDAC